jgi:hypothetical protein
VKKVNSQSTHTIPSSALTKALKAIYGTASALNEFMDTHIAALKASENATISRTGELLGEAKTGFMIGYVTPIAVVAVGQLLLGNPLTAVVSGVGMAVSPVAITCAAVGAIWMGWNALAPGEQAKILELVRDGLGLSVTLVASVIEFVVRQAQVLYGKSQTSVLREMVRAEAANFGKTLAQVTGSAVDAVLDMLPRKPPTPAGDDHTLTEVLWSMEKAELAGMLRDTFGRKRDLEELEAPELRRLLVSSFSDAAAYSWPWASAPSYPETVALVAKQLKLPSSSKVHTVELERMILFKVVELSLERLDDAQKAEIVGRIRAELEARGIERRIAFQEIVSFVKTGGVDIGGTLGGLVLAGPGIYGVAGLNFLQFVVLKGIILSSGYFAGGAALMGFGSGGLMLAVAGWAGPVGAGLAFLFTAYSISGPAYRKLVPAVCMIAAKRLELISHEPNGA